MRVAVHTARVERVAELVADVVAVRLRGRAAGTGRRFGQVREGRAELLVVGVDRVAEVVLGADQLALHHLQRLVDHVVGQPAAVGEARVVAVEHAQPLGVGGRFDGRVEAQLLRRPHRRRLVEALDALQEDVDEVVARLVRRVDLVDRLDELRQLGVGHVLEELRVVPGGRRVEPVLVLLRVDDLVDERVAQPGDLRPVAARVLALGRRPDADHRLVLRLGDHVGRHLEGYGVDVVALERVPAHLGEVTAVQQVEDAQVQEERVVGLAGEGRRAVGQLVHGLVAQLAVVRHGRLADVGRGHRHVVRELRLRHQALLAQLDEVDVVRLRDVQIRVVQAVDGSRVVEEGVLVLRVRAERVPEDQLALRVTVVVDVEVVLRVLRERVEVGSAGRFLERDPVGHERGRVRLVRADERVDVGVVVLRLPRDQRGLPVAGGGGRPRFQHGHTGRRESSGGQRAAEQGGEAPARRALGGEGGHTVPAQRASRSAVRAFVHLSVHPSIRPSVRAFGCAAGPPDCRPGIRRSRRGGLVGAENFLRAVRGRGGGRHADRRTAVVFVAVRPAFSGRRSVIPSEDVIAPNDQ